MRLTRAHGGLGGERRAGVLVASGMLKTVCAKHPWEGLRSLRPMVPGWLGSSSPSFLPCFRPSFLLLPSAPPRCIRYLHVLSLCCVRRAHTCSSCSRGHSHQEGSASAAYAAESHAPMCRRHPPLPVASWLRSRCRGYHSFGRGPEPAETPRCVQPGHTCSPPAPWARRLSPSPA